MPASERCGMYEPITRLGWPLHQKDQIVIEINPSSSPLARLRVHSTRPSRVSRRSRALAKCRCLHWHLRLIPSSRCQDCQSYRASGSSRSGIRSTSFTDAFGWSPVAGSLVEPDGIEPTTSCLQSSALPTELWPRSVCLAEHRADRRPTSRVHTQRVVGLGRFELPTSRLSSARSNQLSYRPDASLDITAPCG